MWVVPPVDASTRKQTNMEHNRLYRLALDAVRDPLVLVRPNGVIVMTNAAAEALFDLDGAARNGRNISALACDRLEIDGAVIRELMAQHESVRDFDLLDENGHACGATLDIEPVHLKGGEEFKLLHFRNSNRDANREFWRDDMIALVSHEIKNPLFAMKQSVDILLSELPGELTEGQRRFLGTSGRSIDRLTHLVEGFLDVSRIRNGAFGIKRTRIDVREFMAETVESFKSLFNVRHVNFDWDVDPTATEAWVDAAKLEQVMINLLSNALKHTPEGGSIHVNVEPAGIEAISDDLRLLPWSDLGAPRLLVIRVTDTGLGMSSDTLDHVFERYHGASADGDARGRGAHLGLNISRALVEAQGGRLAVDSKLGLGTTVTVHVPQNQTTGCLLTRMSRARDLVVQCERSARKVAFVMLGKLTDDDWDDIAASWTIPPAINPGAGEPAGQLFRLWTINSSLAVAVVLDGGDAAVEEVFGTRFVMCEDGVFVFNGYAAGVCNVPGKAVGFAQVCSAAMSRMVTARAVMSKAVDDRSDTDMDCVLNEWKQTS